MNEEKTNLWQIKATVSAKGLPFYEESLGEISSAVMFNEIETGEEKDKWILEAICEQEPNANLLSLLWQNAASATEEEAPAYTVSALPDRNWLKENLSRFKPVSVGRYYIYGSHIKEAPPEDKISLCIDAATAFGSGEHQTTKGCLLALDDLANDESFQPQKILDMGCGSGILSLAAAKTYHKPILAVDIDEESVRVTTESALRNQVTDYITAEVGDGYKKGSVTKNACYDLIFANILAKPLVSMAQDLQKHLSDGGVAVLSGMLTEQEEWVLEAHCQQGLKLKKRYQIDEWSTLIVGKN